MTFLKSVLKSGDITDNVKESYLRAWRSSKCRPEGMLLVGKKSPERGNEFSLEGEEGLPALRILTSFLHPNRLFRSSCTHTKKPVLSFPGIKRNFNICEELGYRTGEKEAKLRTTKTKRDHHYKIYEEQLAELEE